MAESAFGLDAQAILEAAGNRNLAFSCPEELLLKTSTFHGYGIQDFLRAKLRFSSNLAARANPAIANDELAALVDEIHARGMYAIFDIVLNHAGNVFEYVIGRNNNSPEPPFLAEGYQIRWHDQAGNPAFPDIATAATPIVLHRLGRECC